MVERQRVSSLRLADPTVQALWHAVLMFELLPAGFSNRQLRAHLAQLLGQPAQTFTQVRMSYKSATVTFAWLDRTHSKSPPVSPHQLRTSRGSVLHSSLRRNLPPRIGDGGMAMPAASPVPNSLLRCFDRITQEIHAWVDHAKLAA